MLRLRLKSFKFKEMKLLSRFFIGILILAYGPMFVKAQDVYISVPASNIFNRTEFVTIQNVLNTRSHKNWRLGFFAPIWPEIQSTTGDYFTHRTRSGISLPSKILQWQLYSIGGQPAPFRSGDTWPLPYKWFTSSSQYWYQPSSTTGGYTPGNVVFNFKIPSNEFVEYAYYAGEYAIGIAHNYGSGGYNIEFTPNNFNTIISIPGAISWLSNTPSKHIEISSLDNYRAGGAETIFSLGFINIGNTVDFNLMAKSSSSTIQFISSKGQVEVRPVSPISLKSVNPKIHASSLSSTWKNYSSSSNFKVEVGNRTNFELQLSISEVDLRNYFFEAGIYTLQLNLDARSTNNTVSALQNIDITLKVPPLSEITIPINGKQVIFNFITAQDYTNGQSKIVPNHLKISNNETFELYVKSDTPYFTKSGIQSDISSEILEVGVESGSQSVPLSTIPQKIIASGTPVLDKDLDVEYSISPSSAQTLLSKDKNSYTINVIYSFTAL